MKLFRLFSFYLLVTLILLIILARLHLVLVRYIDPDEFAHLHWTYLISQGQLPYRDFFFYITPLYQWFLAPIFLLPHNTFLIILSRLWQYGIYLADLALLYLIAKHLTKDLFTSLLTIIIMASFPMTFDKTIDIRPDMAMVLFFMIGLYLIFKTKNWTAPKLTAVGASFALSFLAIFKIVFALPAILYLLFTAIKKSLPEKILYPSYSGLSRLNRDNSGLDGFIPKNSAAKLSLFGIYPAIGFFIPIFLFLIYLSSNGLLTSGFESYLFTSFAVNSGKMPFSLLLSLSPWPLVYIDRAGISWPWFVNTGLFIASLFGLIILFWENRRIFIFLFLFLGFGFGFLYIFPVPYLQYFLPLSVFISFLSAVFFRFLEKRLKLAPLFTIFLSLALSISFYQQYKLRSHKGVNHQEQFQVVSDILKTTKPDETFYDMNGSYVFRPDGYFICCHPYAEFIDKLRIKPSLLSQSLIKNKTKFLVMDRTGLLFWKTPEPDLTFLKTHYLPSSYYKIYSLGIQFQCAKGECFQHDVNNQPVSGNKTQEFEIIIPENYRVTTDPLRQLVRQSADAGQSVFIDNQPISARPIFLSAGFHRFSVDFGISSLRIQLDR